MAKRSKKNMFWDEDEMYKVMLQYRSLYNIDKKTKTATLVGSPTIRKKLWDNHIHEKMVSVVRSAAVIIDRKNGNNYAVRSLTPDLMHAAVSRLNEVVLFNWAPERRTSLNYMITCARSFLVENYRGTNKSLESLEIGKSKSKSRAVPLDPALCGMPRHKRWMIDDWVAEHHPGCTWTWADKKKGMITISQPYAYITSISEETNDKMEIAAPDPRDTIELVDSIDWQVLSEYIPDATGSQYAKDIAYIILDILEFLVSSDNTTSPINLSIVNSMLSARLPYGITRVVICQSHDVIKQAWRYYAEDFIY